MKKKVLHVINSLTIGGAEILLTNSLSDNGLQEHTDNIVVYFQGTSALQDRIDKRVPVYSLNYSGVKSLPTTLKKLKRLIKENNIDIVHSHLNPAGVYTHLICPVSQVHTLHTTYSMDKETTKAKLWIERNLFLTKKSCNLILLSEFTKSDLLKSIPFKGKTYVLNNFVPDSFFKDSAKTYTGANKSLKLVAVGRLNAGKNFEYLLKVFEYLKDLPIELDIYGDGDIEKYNSIIKETGVKVRMMGHTSDLSALLQKYDVFIMSSKFEGFPLSVFEAMAAGVPLMLSNIAPLKSIVHDNAIYYDLDNAQSVAAIIRSVYLGDTDINSMASTGKQYAENTVRREKYITNLLSIYDDVLKEAVAS